MNSKTERKSTYHLFGIRHHGPGSATMLLKELEKLNPDCLLIEGPPDAEPLLPFAADSAMEPPVAILIYAKESPKCATFFPFAIFSPEWQAIRFGLRSGATVRFMDLPQRHQLALLADNSEPSEKQQEKVNEPSGQNPLNQIAQAAGWSDGEEWWESLIEERNDQTDTFTAIQEVMTELRQNTKRDLLPESELREQQREAYMRETMRKAAKDGFQNIAIICGAWHVPALADLSKINANDDRNILKNLPKITTEATWAPWTYGRIAINSGYGAGITAPGYYEYLWQHQSNNYGHSHAVGWLTRVAQLLREESIDCSSAHVIETVRLANSLAAFRHRPKPGLTELNEAVQSVISMGDDTHIQLIQRKLLIGERLGHVPDTVPLVPIANDLAKQQKSLRIKPEALHRLLDLDLRKPTDTERSYLLYRLRLLKINWGKLQENASRGAKGTFHEIWQLQWAPEFAINLVEAAVWGNTVETASAAFALNLASINTELSEVAALAQTVLEANLPTAIPGVMARLETLAATTGAVSQLLEAIPPLAKAFRYGSVRNFDASQLGHILDGMIERTCISLPGACTSLDDDAAHAMHTRLLAVHQAIQFLENTNHISNWQQTLILLANRDSLHGLIKGTAARRLLDDQVEASECTQQRLSLALSPGVEPTEAAAWLQGFLYGSGIILLHNDQLWTAIDSWLSNLNEEGFVRILPLVRRTFSQFPTGERRQMGERAKQPLTKPKQTLAVTQTPNTISTSRSQALADRLAPVLKNILGLYSQSTIK